jgi:hypothetical protein
MLRPFLAVFATFCLLASSTLAAEPQPDKIQLVLNASSYGFQPNKNPDIGIDQPSPTKDFKMTLERSDHRMPFGDMIPGWRGSTDVELQGGYHLKVNARYLRGQPMADFTNNKIGLSLDISYYYDKQLIGFQTETQWVEPSAALKVTAELKDIPYFDLLSQNDFVLPAETDGYGEGFRAWTAVRDGLKARDQKDASYKTLSEFLKPLNRKDNLMIPTVTVTAKVQQPKGK